MAFAALTLPALFAWVGVLVCGCLAVAWCVLACFGGVVARALVLCLCVLCVLCASFAHLLCVCRPWLWEWCGCRSAFERLSFDHGVWLAVSPAVVLLLLCLFLQRVWLAVCFSRCVLLLRVFVLVQLVQGV